jgi:isoleucyl-tRNA synthetase
VNRLQNRRKDQDFAITDRIRIELYTESDLLKKAVQENQEYIMGETQADTLVWMDSSNTLQETEADGEKVFVEATQIKK